MKRVWWRTSAVVSALPVFMIVAYAQFGRGGAEWMTDGSDAQRSHWIPADAQISPESLRKNAFQFLWKTKLNNESVQLNSLTPAVLLDRYIGYRGFRSLAFLSGSANMVYGIDTDLSRIEWQQRLSGAPPLEGSSTCPSGVTSNVARLLLLGYPTATPGGGGLGGRGGPAKSAVGAPDQGAVNVAAPLRAPATAPAASRSQVAPQNPVARAQIVYAISSDGKLHSLFVSNGVEPEPPMDFLPPNANARGLIVLDGAAYAVTGNCNGGASAVWALDLRTKSITKWQPSAGAIAGAVGPAFGPGGEVYVATDDGELAALEAKTLSVTGTYSASGQQFTSSPVVFPYRGKNLIALATKDGRIHVLDAATLSASNPSPLAVSAAYSTDGSFAPGTLATWQALDGTRWLLAAADGSPGQGSGFSATIVKGAVAAWRLVNRNDHLSLEAGWLSRDLVSPLAPMIVNGVVFAVSSGESKDAKLSTGERIRQSSPAVVYALDGASGRPLWDSGNTITSFVHSGGLSGGAGQIYLQTYDQTLYAFGFPMEH